MIADPRLDGAVPLDSEQIQDIALAALTRRVAELEHRLNMMKIIIGLVLAAKVLLVLFVFYIVFGIDAHIRSGDRIRPTAQPARLVSAGGIACSG